MPINYQKDIWLRWLIPSCFFLVSLNGNRVFHPPITNEKISLLFELILMAALAFEMNRFIILKVRKGITGLNQVAKRIIIALLICIAFNLLLLFGAINIHMIFFPAKVQVSFYLRLIVYLTDSFLVSTLSVAIYEAHYIYLRLKKTEKEKEDLIKSHLQSQYDSLKGQVNPHFLFNSLNSLRQLILKDQQQAALYVEQLSDVYRYLLRSNETNITTLKKELDFIEAYNHLLKTRFGDGYRPVIKVEPKYFDSGIPPLTLQMLVENAVKHNIISVSQPLHLTIAANADGKLHITNNLQRKTQSVPSDKTGLANIMTKYKLLNAAQVEIKETDNEFSVVLPLIKKEEYADSDN